MGREGFLRNESRRRSRAACVLRSQYAADLSGLTALSGHFSSVWMLHACFLCVFGMLSALGHIVAPAWRPRLAPICRGCSPNGIALQWLHDDGGWACPHAWYSPLVKIHPLNYVMLVFFKKKKNLYMSWSPSSVHSCFLGEPHHFHASLPAPWLPSYVGKTVGGWVPCSRVSHWQLWRKWRPSFSTTCEEVNGRPYVPGSPSPSTTRHQRDEKKNELTKMIQNILKAFTNHRLVFSIKFMRVVLPLPTPMKLLKRDSP